MLRWIFDVVGGMSYWGVALLMAIENIVLPMPSELIMPLAGFLSARGRMSLLGVIVAGAIGSAVGALPLYAVARRYGKKSVTHWVDRHGKWLFLRGRDLVRASERFERHGGAAVFFSQLLPGLRGLIALPAGFARMQVIFFELTNFLGTLIWCGVLAWLGHLLGANFERVHEVLGPATWALFGALFVGALTWLIHRRHARR